MIRFLKYIFVFLIGFFIAKFWYDKDSSKHQSEEIQVVLNSIKNISKLVVSSANFSETYSYAESKKYFYDYISFDKKAIVTVNANVEVGYDLSKLEIQVDSIAKKIYINKIPNQEVTISPDIKYFDVQQSTFNAFSKDDLNKINQKSIEKIKGVVQISELKEKSKTRLLEELSKIYQLSVIYNWEVVDNTKTGFLNKLKP